ncbi:hypothetical protein VI06_20935 [Aquitalea magnusonii]|nr:hypothetical protein VI06_20935 [Aquitalea magnusonii]
MQSLISLLRSTNLDPGAIIVGIRAVPRDHHIRVDSAAVSGFMRLHGRTYNALNGLFELGDLVEVFECQVLAALSKNPRLSTINSKQLNW